MLPEGCTLAAPNVTGCPQDRGGLFFRNQSSTWSTERIANNGLFSLSTFEENRLGLGGNAFYGFDTVQLGYVGSESPTLEGQLIAGIAGYDFWLGSLGMSPLTFNFTDTGDPIPSYLGSLREQKLVGSTSWAYTAGASYRDPPIYGSLTFGGSDELRYDKGQALSKIPFGADSSRDLLVGLQSITYDTHGSPPLLAEGIYAFIDSMVTDLWLPVETCIAFEQAFNLTWNVTDETYWLSEAVHKQLVEQNPTFNLTLGVSSEVEGGQVNVVLPYKAFDLEMKPPFVQNPTRYFPLKRAQNSTQYTLGRVFLQEAYVIADYDRSEFTVAQALVPTPASAVKIVENVDAAPVPSRSGEAHRKTTHGLGKRVIAGIAVGCSVLVLVVVVSLFWFCRKHRRASKSDDILATNSDDEVRQIHEVSGKTNIGSEYWSEMSGNESIVQELHARGPGRAELPWEPGPGNRQELAATERQLAQCIGDGSRPPELIGESRRERVYELGG